MQKTRKSQPDVTTNFFARTFYAVKLEFGKDRIKYLKKLERRFYYANQNGNKRKVQRTFKKNCASEL